MSSRDFHSVPPPKNLDARQTYSRQKDVHGTASTARAEMEANLPGKSMFSRRSTKFGSSEDDYFERDDEPPSTDSKRKQPDDNDGDDEIDPLDAFMAELESGTKTNNKKTIKKSETESTSSNSAKSKTAKGVRHDIEEEDLEESYYKYMEANPNAGVGTMANSDDEANTEQTLEYDEDGNPIGPSKKLIDPLPMIYHSEIEYAPFQKNFYKEHEEIKRLTGAECQELRRKLGIRVSGPSPPKPCSSFGHFGFDEQLMKLIRKMEFSSPTPIQAQAIPAALAGRDVIGIAKTGSGKTAAYLWPMLVHLLDQPPLKPGDGPPGLILAPTRELSQQIYQEAKRFAKPYGLRVLCAYGGGSKYEQSKDLEQGADIIVATPGRMIDFVKMKATNLQRVTFLVLDEADRMFDMGFEPQVRSICNHVRPDRQTLMFSATFKKKIEKLARDVLTDPVRIVQGDVGEANQDVTQIVHVLKSQAEKWDWLMANLVEFSSNGSVLIFVTKKANAQELAQNLETKTNFKPLLLHGDMNQLDRNKVITAFKRQESQILVATDVAARGLDIPHIRTVINYDMALDIDTHTHRIGRTGRAGESGTAYTLVTDKDKEMVGHLVRNLESANQPVSDELMNLAMQSQWFRKSRFKQGGAAAAAAAFASARQNLKPKFGLGFQSASNTSTSTSSSSKSSQSVTDSTGRPANDRVATMASVFQNRFRSQFTPATDTAWNQQNQAKNKRSRWQ